jgi:hypothetical protein
MEIKIVFYKNNRQVKAETECPHCHLFYTQIHYMDDTSSYHGLCSLPATPRFCGICGKPLIKKRTLME